MGVPLHWLLLDTKAGESEALPRSTEVTRPCLLEAGDEPWWMSAKVCSLSAFSNAPNDQISINDTLPCWHLELQSPKEKTKASGSS